MTDLRARALECFVAPRSPAEPPGRRDDTRLGTVESPAAGVLGAPGQAQAVAALLAGAVRVRARAACVLVAEWADAERMAEAPGLASRPARKLAGRLQVRGLDATAAGRSARLRLPGDPQAAALEWRRAAGAVDCPAICALAGPRPALLGPILDTLDLIVAVLPADASRELGELVRAGLAGARAPVALMRPVPGGGIARALSSSSLATARMLGPDVNEAVRALA